MTLTARAVVPQELGVLVAVAHPLAAAHLTVRPGLLIAASAVTVRRKYGVRPLLASPPRAGHSMTETAVAPGWLGLGATAPIVLAQALARCSSPAT